MRLAGEIALVTGGSAGYGKSIAKKLVQEGARVLIAARGEAALREAQKETGCEDIAVMDVTRAQDWERVQKGIVKQFGRLDILVNNAGGAVAVRELTDLTLDEIDSAVALNLNSALYGCKFFGGLMKSQRHGTIINVSSGCATEAWPGWGPYTAAKAGMLGLSKVLHTELGPYGVRVTCLLPGAGATDFMKNAGGRNQQMVLQPDDIGQAALDICLLPAHVIVEEMRVWGSDQIVVPL